MKSFPNPLALLWLALVLIAGPHAFAAPTDTAALHIRIENLPTQQGFVKVMITDQAKHFLEEEQAFFKVMVRADRLNAEGFTVHLKPGHYTVAVVHDINSNNVFDHNALGVPEEPFGFSNNPTIFFGPPDFDDCVFEHGTQSQTIHIKLKTF